MKTTILFCWLNAILCTSTAATTTVKPVTTVISQVTTYAEIKSGSCGTNGMRFLTTPDECKLAALTLGLPTSLTGDLLNPLTVDAVNPDRPQGCYVLYVEPNKVPRLNFATSEQTKGKGAEQSTKDRARHPICAIFGTWVLGEPRGCASKCGVGVGLSGTPGAVNCTTSSCDPDKKPPPIQCPKTAVCAGAVGVIVGVSVAVVAVVTGTAVAVVTATGAGSGTSGAAVVSIAASGAGAGATATAAGATAAGAGATTAAGTGAAIGASVAGAASVAAALLAKYGLKPKALHQTNILSPETSAQRMMSKEVLRVKDAPDMNLLETVRHFSFLLSKKTLKFINGEKSKSGESLECEIEEFSAQIQEDLAKYYSEQHKEQKVEVSIDPENFPDNATSAPVEALSSSARTANAATAMFEESASRKADSENGVADIDPITKKQQDVVIDKASRSLAWAHDPDRPAVPGAEQMTNDQAAAIMLYTQESCLYRRLNAALRNHDMRSLAPLLPYMKLLLSALYQLPLTPARTYRGVKLELFQTYNLLAGQVWCWRSFSSTTRNKEVLLKIASFFGTKGKRTLFSINAVGVDIAPFSAMSNEEEVLLLPGLPLINLAGENPEPDMWTFEIETPGESVAAMEGDSPPVMIDYVHPDWNAVFYDGTWRQF